MLSLINGTISVFAWGYAKLNCITCEFILRPPNVANFRFNVSRCNRQSEFTVAFSDISLILRSFAA